MRGWRSALTVTTALVAAAVTAIGVGAPASAASARHWPNSLHASGSERLHLGERLVSANGRYYAAMQRDGRLAVRTARGTLQWHTPAVGANAHLTMGTNGQVMLVAGGRARWQTNTRGSGSGNVLTLGNDGLLTLTSRGALVWSDRVGSACPRGRGNAFVVDLSRQFARACSSGQQIRATPITSGASSLGDATPQGTWRVQARIRNTTLYPAGGGAYPVHYWMPYNGPYGMHDSPWQRFPYGSSRYRTQGSHGCVHVPGPMMAWLFGWARVGTTVTIHA